MKMETNTNTSYNPVVIAAPNYQNMTTDDEQFFVVVGCSRYGIYAAIYNHNGYRVDDSKYLRYCCL